MPSQDESMPFVQHLFHIPSKFTILAHFEAPWEETDGGEGMKIKAVGLSFSILSVLLVFFTN